MDEQAVGLLMLALALVMASGVEQIGSGVMRGSDQDILARTIWGEARGDGSRGMQAVANVVMNRVRKGGWWGATVKAVCLKPYQFSCWNAGDPNQEKLLAVTTDDPSFVTALEIAGQAIAGTLPDITNGATHYHTVDIATPKEWGPDPVYTASVGRQVFFNGIA